MNPTNNFFLLVATDPSMEHNKYTAQTQ